MGFEPLIPNPPANPYPLLALDLSTVAVGWAICAPPFIPKCDSAHPKASLSLEERLDWLGWFISAAFTPALGEPVISAMPRLVVVEVTDYRERSMRHTAESAQALGKAAGVVHECCRRAGVPMVEVDARRVRERLCGKATATKEEAQRDLVRRGYVLPTRNAKIDHDAADALALLVAVHDELVMLSKAQEG